MERTQWLHFEYRAAKGHNDNLADRDGAGNRNKCGISDQPSEAASVWRQGSAIDLIPNLEEDINGEENANLQDGERHFRAAASYIFEAGIGRVATNLPLVG